tara:strand:+ start:61 stop:327 length:267 start_codon:yes stop_codon:yes gene_type:complete
MITYFIYFAILFIFIFVIFITVKSVYKNLNMKEDLDINNRDKSEYIDIDDNKSIPSLTKELNELNKLYQEGVINEEEFLKAKNKILDN